MEILFSIYFELFTMHPMGGKRRIPAEGVDCLLPLILLREKPLHQYKQLHCLLSSLLYTGWRGPHLRTTGILDTVNVSHFIR